MLITSSAERNAKYRREQELKRAMFALGNPTVDQKYITDFGNSASKFISDSAKGVSGVAFGQSQQALDRYNAQAQRLKYQKLVIEDFLERNAEKGSYTELQNALNNIQKDIDNVGNAYINTHNMMSQYKTEDEYNRDKITSQHVGSTYDEILAEITRLGEEQKNQTPETAAETQKNRDVLNNLLYNNNYIERDSYQKAIADIDRQIAEIEKTIGKPPVGMVARSVYDAKNGEAANKINYLKTLKSTLEEKEKITEFTELPAKLGEHNFQIGVSNGKIKGQYNPTADQLRQWMQKYVDSSYDEQMKMFDEKPEIVDPLGFIEQNPDLWVQEGPNSRLSNIFLTEIYNHAKEYHWDEITPEEKDIYYFTLNRLGKDKAMEYLSLLERYFGQRYAADITKSIEEFTDKAGWLGGTFINIALIPVSMIGNAEAALTGFGDYVSGEGINPYSSANRLRLGTTAIRGGTAKEWGKAADWELFGKNVFEQSFNILMSTGESLFGGLALGPAYMFFAGSGAAMSTAQDIYDRGGSANQVFFGALASGIAEAVFEKISIDRLVSGAESITGFKETFKQILIQGGVETSEEVLTEMANTISDNLIMAEKSTVSLRAKELMDENPSMTPTEARKKAETEVVAEVIWAGLSGFISGGLNIGVIGTTGIVANKFDQKKQSVATQQIIGNQLKSDGTAEAFINFAISQGLVKDGTTVDSLSSEALGKVYQDFCDKFYETASKSKTSTELLSVVEKYNTEETPDVVKRYVGAVAATVLAEHPEWAPETSEATTVDVDSVVDDSAGGVEAAEESVLPNVSAAAPEADPIKDDAFAARGLERLTEEQRLLKSIGESLGRKVEFKNLDKWVKDPETGKLRRVSPGGMINKTTGVLYLNNSKYAYQNALREVLKHEITHFAEIDTESYALFQKGIMDSQVFKDWVKRKGYKGTVNEDGYAVSATSNMNAAYIKRYAESGLEGTEVFKGKDAEDAANREMVADFVAENLFTDKMSRLRDALSDVQPETVNKFKQLILDLLKKLKNAFRSQAKVYESIEGIESEFVKVCKSAQRIWEQKHKQTAEQQKNNEEGNEISPDTEGVTVNAKGEPVAHNSQNEDLRYSLPDNKDRLLEMYEAGQITKEQLFEALENKPQRENPASIAKLKPEDASTTPELKKKTGENKGDSESKFYESAMKSSIFDESFKNDIKDDTYIQSYNRITNKETLKKAADMLDEGGQVGVTAWFAKPLDTVSLTDIAIGLILMDRYQRVGDYQSAAAAAQRVRMMGTSSGQQVQIFSILGRFTPEGMVHYAQKELDQAYQKFIDTKAKKWAEKNADKFKLTPEDIEKIRRNTLQATALPEDSRARAILLAEICSLVQNKIPPTVADSLRAWQRIAMLLNVRTNIRNILGNAGMTPVFIASDFFGTFVDKAIARTTGVRTTGNFSIKGSGKAFAKGFYESLDDFRRDVHTKQEELNRFELDGFKGREAPGKNFNANTKSAAWNKMADILNGLDRFTSFCLEAGDRTFFEMWVNNSLNNQMRLNGVTEPTPEMLLAATEEALQRTWQDNSQMARVVSKLKQTMNIANIGGYGLGDVLVKFTKTPANIAKAIIDFSPAGFIFATKNIVQMRQAFEKGQLTPAMQNKAVKSMSNAITGTLIYLLVTALASAGVIKLSGDSDDDKDVSNFERYIVGIPPYSMEFFGVNVTYDWMQPFGSVLAIVSEYMENKKDKSTGLGDDLVQAVMAGGEVFTKQSFLQSLYEFFSNSDENFIMGLSQAVASDPSVFIPQLISQTASIIDPKRRMTYDNNFWKNSLNQVISKIPGLRMLLPEQVNVMGETIENNQFLNPWLAFVAPYNTYPDSYGKTAEKIYDLYKTTGDKEVIPRSAPKNFSVKGHKYSFTQKQKQEFQRDMGQASAEMLDIFFKSKEYQKLNDAQKVDVIKSIYGYSTKLAKFNVVKNDYDYALLSDIIGYKDEEETQPILTKSKYDSLSQKAKIQIVEEGIFTTKERALKNYNEAVKYFISKTK